MTQQLAVQEYCDKTGQENPECGNVPTNLWACEIEVRRRGAIGTFDVTSVIVRAEPRDVRRYIWDEIAARGLEPRTVKWIRRISR